MYKRLTNRENGEITGEFTFREALERLAGLEDKIESGTLIELPCKVGDTAYGIWKDEVGEYYISADEVMCISVCEGYFFFYGDDNNELNAEFDEDYVCLFFTKEEAEAKLKELEEENE